MCVCHSLFFISSYLIQYFSRLEKSCSGRLSRYLGYFTLQLSVCVGILHVKSFTLCIYFNSGLTVTSLTDCCSFILPYFIIYILTEDNVIVYGQNVGMKLLILNAGAEAQYFFFLYMKSLYSKKVKDFD